MTKTRQLALLDLALMFFGLVLIYIPPTRIAGIGIILGALLIEVPLLPRLMREKADGEHGHQRSAAVLVLALTFVVTAVVVAVISLFA